MASTNADGRVSYTEHEMKDPELHERLRYQVGRENEPWRVEVGTNYSRSYTNPETSNDSFSANPQEPAPTTDSHSSVSPTVADSTATLTDGAGQSRTAQPSGKPTRQKKSVPAKRQANTRVIDEYDEFE